MSLPILRQSAFPFSSCFLSLVHSLACKNTSICNPISIGRSELKTLAFLSLQIKQIGASNGIPKKKLLPIYSPRMYNLHSLIQDKKNMGIKFTGEEKVDNSCRLFLTHGAPSPSLCDAREEEREIDAGFAKDLVFFSERFKNKTFKFTFCLFYTTK